MKMDDVASVRSENANLRKIQQKLLQWEKKENQLAPLSNLQLEVIDRLQDILESSNTTSEVFIKKLHPLFTLLLLNQIIYISEITK